MTQEEKQLLLKDLCPRLPYGVQVQNITNGREHIKGSILSISRYEPYSVYILTDFASGNQEYSPIEDIKHYLRPMSSMTEEEHEEYKSLFELFGKIPVVKQDDKYFDFINSHHFDYRGLIEKGLAIEAPEGMYDIK